MSFDVWRMAKYFVPSGNMTLYGVHAISSVAKLSTSSKLSGWLSVLEANTSNDSMPYLSVMALR